MALQVSGEIAFSQIEAEFGQNPKRSLGRYRISETYGELTNVALDRGIPQTGQIKFSDFYDKRLNMVVNFYDGVNVEAQQNMKVRFNTTINKNIPEKVKAVGGFISPLPTTTGGPVSQLENHKRVIINVSKIIAPRTSSSYKPNKKNWKGYNPDPPNNQNEVSMITGDWDLNTELDLFVGPSGFIVGAGGAGGKNGHEDGGKNGPGDVGTSALGVTFPLNIYAKGKIAGGGGGGGGSPFTLVEDRRRKQIINEDGSVSRGGRRRYDRKVNGGAGGGGAGYSGLAPDATTDNQYGGPGGANRKQNPSPGLPGTLTDGGAGGAPHRRNRNTGSPGADGGDLGASGGSIGRLGIGGAAGHAIIISGSGNATLKEGGQNVIGGTHAATYNPEDPFIFD